MHNAPVIIVANYCHGAVPIAYRILFSVPKANVRLFTLVLYKLRRLRGAQQMPKFKVPVGQEKNEIYYQIKTTAVG